MESSPGKAPEMQQLLEEVDNLVFDVCQLRKNRPAEILSILKEVNNKKANRLASDIKVIPPRDSMVNSREAMDRMVDKLSEAENRNTRLVNAEAASKEIQATLQEKRQIVDALHYLLNSAYAPIDCPKINLP
ncbi:hypothetical protein PFISCL1PPCAC_10227 [Pristionchus fissidentatus]|uniref:Uncharacterized protein n=1 Tax=Pristionchus fissidentatus TaxID=1538716 RepID=A0AAV5VLU6_9BILA|nr:hypothetical protein PFISCL1PPCAC_10227 [Pristionchus fissidentatus]